MNRLNLLINKLSEYHSRVCLSLQVLNNTEETDINNMMEELGNSTDPNYYQACILGYNALRDSNLIKSGQINEVLPTNEY